MARNPAPTKANLFKARHDLRFATQGCELLHQKRDVLVLELMSVTAAFSDSEKRLRERLAGTLDAFVPAYLTAGQELMERVYAAVGSELSLEVEQRGVMGILVPEVGVQSGADPVFPGLLDGSDGLDGAVAGMREVVEALARYVEAAATIWRLASEIEKTQRRINAIENVFIPEARRTVAWIKSVMEENDREELFRRKLLKSRASQTGDDHGEPVR
ncbi:MAG: V-type ATP synthase subunit D [Kiritimatiellae bacterium]|nr:V-type ATP synthase subunit D [Kiritimatiellia bacterium]